MKKKMVYRIAFLSIAAAALGAAALPHPSAAADYYDEGRRPAVHYGQDGQDEGAIDGDRRPDPRAFGGDRRRAPGPVAFDDRDPDRHFDRRPWGHGLPEGIDRRPVGPVPADGGRAFGARFDRPFGEDGGFGVPDGPWPPYRAVPVAVEEDAFDGRSGRPDAGCTIQQAESITPTGWRKIVTHRTCYRR